MFHVPNPDQRFLDSGRRTILIGGRPVGAALALLTPEDAARYRASHEIFIKNEGVAASAKPGLVVEFDGTAYRVTAVTDPKANDPTMKGRYRRLICSPV
jgi:hypothetical protein